MKSYQVLKDPYHNVQRLNLFKFDGSPIQPMYLQFSPPQMLPTQTLNPTSRATATAKSRVKRTEGSDGDGEQVPLNSNIRMGQQKEEGVLNADRWWWAGVGLTALGTVMYMLPTSL